MAVTFDSAGPAGTVPSSCRNITGSGPCTWTHNCGASATCLPAGPAVDGGPLSIVPAGCRTGSDVP